MMNIWMNTTHHYTTVMTWFTEFSLSIITCVCVCDSQFLTLLIPVHVTRLPCSYSEGGNQSFQAATSCLEDI